MSRPHQEPLGLLLGRVARTNARAFEARLAEAGGSLPVWHILTSLRDGVPKSHATLAAAIGLTGPTLTHHLDQMERDGLVRRERPTADRRTQYALLTGRGLAMFDQLLDAARAHDTQLRAALSADEVETLRDLLDRLHGTP